MPSSFSMRAGEGHPTDSRSQVSPPFYTTFILGVLGISSLHTFVRFLYASGPEIRG
ncbi:hypothetical protein M407DRAFT_200151 [Tulasnella calospora MUT 4182]|uniref:Uncharacterized protein n=1 Tax=Tulasnella calospora MUT 4182 TaxID=1051891 RepID=A0A0C3LYS0_9AGAM|nr:hypothetical protein M407DRAFT_200151 [Tulasnella calospora MUT 4182]